MQDIRLSVNSITEKNHYVPRFYLNRWSGDDGKLAVHRLIVRNAKVPEWRRYHPASVGYHEHLYTRGPASALSDDIEQWLAREFENPAGPVIAKAIAGTSLSPADWSVLIRFAACQDLRTPARMLVFLRRQQASMPALIQGVMEDAKATLEQAHAEGRQIESRPTDDSTLSELPARFTVGPGPDEQTGSLQCNIVVGRELWLWNLERMLNYTAQFLLQHRWTILRSPIGMSWLTSDNPVIRLAYVSAQEYSLDGGWARPGCEIFLPLGPEHILYTKVGDRRPPPRGTRCELALAAALQRFTIENAHRMVFGLEPDSTVDRIRPRRIDAALIDQESREWAEWHSSQLDAYTPSPFSEPVSGAEDDLECAP